MRGAYGLCRQAASSPGDVVGGDREDEAGAHALDTAFDGLGRAAGGLGTAEGLLDPIAVLNRWSHSQCRVARPSSNLGPLSVLASLGSVVKAMLTLSRLNSGWKSACNPRAEVAALLWPLGDGSSHSFIPDTSRKRSA